MAGVALVVSAFLIGLVAARLVYGRTKTAFGQSASFSPMIATIITAPLLAVACIILETTDFVRGSAELEFRRGLNDVVVFWPAILGFSALLAAYNRGWPYFLRGRMILVSYVTILVVQYLWIAWPFSDWE
jgi:hypothetical protein